MDQTSDRSSRLHFTHAFEVVVGLVLIASAGIKGYEASLFAVQIAGYEILPSALEFPAAVAIVLAEAVLGAALVAGIFRPWPGALTIVLLVGFSGVFLYGYYALGLTECGCFGDFLKLPPAVTFGKNAVLVAMLLAAFVRRRVAMEPKNLSILIGGLLFVVACGALAVGGYRYVSGLGATNARVSGPIDAARPYARFVFDEGGAKYDLGRGTYLVAWLSTTCPECRKAVGQIAELMRLIPNMPKVIGLCLGDGATLESFRDETLAPFATVLVPAGVFTEFVPAEPPHFVLIRDGAPVAQWDMQIPPTELLDRLGGM
ncbi:hypothetical protein LLG95_05160 [bacterium]|nr:hypothetical protein [bacterium]